VHRDVLHQRLELGSLGHEVGLAVHFDQDAHLVPGVDVGGDDPLGSGPAGLLGGRRQALLPQDLPGVFEVALGLHQRRLAVHHPGAGLFPELAHHFRGNAHANLK
jgi:hypothetical protein